MFCSKCGQENIDDAKFCSSCGNALGSDVEKSAEQKAEEIKQKSKESASTLFYLLKPLLKAKILVPIIAIVFFVVFYPNMKSAYDKHQYEQQKLEKVKQKVAEEQKETFTDTATGLLWQDDSYERTKTWDNTISYCKTTQYAGYDDWYLPTKEQLQDLYTKKNKLNHVSYGAYWSSSEYVGDSSEAWLINFVAGNTLWDGKSYQFYVRCVRGR